MPGFIVFVHTVRMYSTAAEIESWRGFPSDHHARLSVAPLGYPSRVRNLN